MTPILLAIDPGKSGGMALCYQHEDDSTKYRSTQVLPMRESPTEIIQTLRVFVTNGHRITCAIEKVGGFAGGKFNTGSSMFVFGKSVGILYGCLMTLDIPLREVTPQAWQKFVGAGTTKTHGGGNKAAWKRHLLELAKQRHPGVAGLTLKTCDALLILDWLKGQGV